MNRRQRKYILPYLFSFFLSEAERETEMITYLLTLLNQLTKTGYTLAWLGHTLRSWVHGVLINFGTFSLRLETNNTLKSSSKSFP